MITIKYRDLKFTSMLCLSLMSIVFFIGWLKAFIGIPLAILLFVAVIISRKPDDRELKIKASSLIFIVVAVLIWSFLAGQGGFFTQKEDHWARNVIFRDLITHDWPVILGGENDEGLVYYIGHWLIPALFGKIGCNIAGFETGYLVARIALFFWTSLIVILAILNVAMKVNCNNYKKIAIMMTVFILFSGMDAFGALANVKFFEYHIEWWAACFQYTSMTTQLFWVYNQCAAAWLATAIALNEKDESNYALIGMLILPSSPLPLVGLAVYLLAKAFVKLVKLAKLKQTKIFFKNVFSIQNILAVITILPVYLLYYVNNFASSGQASGEESSLIVKIDVFVVILYVLFILLEFLIMATLLYKKENKVSWIIVVVSLLIIPFIKVGTSADFCMRASIPALFILMVMLMEFFINYKGTKESIKSDKEKKDYKFKALLLSIIFVIGSVTPMVEFGTSIRDYVESNGECVNAQEKYESLETLSDGQKINFVGRDFSNSAFYEYLMKK